MMSMILKMCLLFLALGSASIAQAQQQCKAWDQRHGSTTGAQTIGVASLPDGGFAMLASVSGGGGNVTQPALGGTDFWLVRFDADGNWLWDMRYGGSGNDAPVDLTATADGGFLLLGTTDGGISGNVTEAGAGGKDWWMIRVSANGSVLWDKRLGSSIDDNPEQVAAMPDGGFFLIGRLRGTQIGSNCLYLRGVRLNANGIGLWSACYPQFSTATSKELLAEPNGDAVFFHTPGASMSRIAASALGGVLQTTNYTAPGVLQLNAAARTADGGFAFCAISNGGVGGDKTQPGRGGYDFWVVRTSSTGAVQWDATYGGAGDDYPWGMSALPNGEFQIIGTTAGDASGERTQNSRGVDDFWTVRAAASGTLNWEARYGGSSYDSGSRVHVSSNGSIYLMGGSSSNISGDRSAPLGTGDLWMLKIDGAAATAWYRDADADGLGNPAISVLACDAQPGYVQNNSDCNDNLIAGSPCDDANPSTTWDTWGADCLCTGQPSGSVCTSWDTRFGGTSFDYFTSMEATADGGFLFGGYSSSNAGGDKSQSHRGGNDYWVVKASASGAKQWDARFGTTSSEQLTELVPLPNGDALLAGWSAGGINGERTQASQGGNDYWVVLTNALGVKLWDKRFGGSANDELTDAAATADGGFILLGSSSSGIGGDRTEDSRGAQDYWLVKTDASGNKLWDKRFGGAAADHASDLLVLNDGYLLTGRSASGIGGDKTQASRGGDDLWIVMTDLNGNKLWDVRFGGTASDGENATAAIADGSIYVACRSYSGNDGDKTQPSQGQSDYWLLRCDMAGNKIWDRRYGTTAVDIPTRLRPGASGVWLAGYSAGSANGDRTEATRGGNDAWVFRINSTGVKILDKRYGSAASDDNTELIITPDGGFLVGSSSAGGHGGDRSCFTRGLNDYWVLKNTPGAPGTWYADADGDGYGNASSSVSACELPVGHVSIISDCNDSDASAYPGSSCSDGNACTTGDTYSTTCQCIGVLSPDTDGDGVCNVLDGCPTDPNKTAPGICGCANPEPGTPCNDNNEGTGNDVITASCTCAGVPLDCENIPGGTAAPGQACDDNDPWTPSTNYDANCGCAGAPSVCKRYDRRYGTTSEDDLRALVATSDGGQIMAMHASSASGDVMATPVGGGDYYVFRTNAEGGFVWRRMYGGTGAEEPYAAVATSDGGFLIGGSSASGVSGDRTEPSQGGLDYWVIRIDANGTKLWDKRFGGSGTDVLREMAVTADGGFVLLGESNSPASGDKAAGPCVPFDTDLWVLRITATGSLLWQTNLGSNAPDLARSLSIAADGSILVGAINTTNDPGCTVSQIGYDVGFGGGVGDYWITKLNSAGAELWDKRYGGSGSDYLRRALWTSNGGVVLFGSSTSPVSGVRTAPSFGSTDIWVVQTDASGNKLWDRAFGGSGNDALNDVVAMPGGGWMLAGQTDSPVGGSVTGTPRGGTDAWVLRLGGNLRRAWDLRFGTNAEDLAKCIALGSDGYPIIGCNSRGGISGDRTQANWGASSADVWTLRLDAGRTWYQDLDGDGFGNAAQSTTACSKPAGYTADALDCNDSDAGIYPGAPCDDGIAGNPPSVRNASCACVSPPALCRQWDKRFGSSADDDATRIIATSDGGYLIGGWSTGGISGDRTENSRGLEDYWVVKVDANGTKQWDKRYGGSGYEILTCLLQANDGGYLIGGYTSASSSGGDNNSASYGNADFWVVKTDANGVKQWDRHYGGYDLDWMGDMVASPDGGYLFAGLSWSSDGQVTQGSQGMGDYWVVKVNDSGVKQWDKRFGSSGNELLHRATVTSDGHYVLCGESPGPASGDKSEGSRGGTDIWVVKMSVTGQLLWERTLGGPGSEAGYGLAPDLNGGVAVGTYWAGALGGDRTWPVSGPGALDTWVVRLDASGTKLWDRGYGSSGVNRLWDMKSTGDGGFYIGLEWVEGDGICSVNDNGWGFNQWVGRLDANGVKLWDRGYSAAGQTELRAMAAGTDRLALLALSNAGIFNDRSQDSRGGFDYWTVALAPGQEQEWSLDVDADGFGQPLVPSVSPIAHACAAPSGFAAPGDCDDFAATIFPGAPCNDGNPATSLDQYSASCVCAGTVFSLRVAPRLVLDGPFVSASNLMNDALRTAGYIPQGEPYSAIGYPHAGGGGNEVLFPGVLSVSGNNAIVDWVVVELRSNSNPANVLATRSALVQRDGDVVDVDGTSPVGFSIGAGTYRVAVRHRNHLGAMTLNGVALSSGAVTVDFTLATTLAYGTNARKVNGSKLTLWPGDVNRDGIIRYVGNNNDRDPILIAIGGLVPSNTVSGYRLEDVDLSGVVKYTGAGNDRDPILISIGGSVPTNSIQHQLP